MTSPLEQASASMSDLLTKLERLSTHSPLIQRRDALQVGVSSTALTRLTREGSLLRVGRGLYQLAEAKAPSPELVEVSLRHPKAVIVLISALAFHSIGTQRSGEVWVQLPINAPTPGTKWPPLRVVRSRLDKAFTEGVETHQIGGHPVRITSVDRTIVDCFKHRSLVGLDVAVEALRERMSQRSGARRSLQNLHRYSRLMRVSRIMQPYMEAMV
jgi:predicted transcriptional regulator of viral defense system